MAEGQRLIKFRSPAGAGSYETNVAGLFVDPDFGPVLANYGLDDEIVASYDVLTMVATDEEWLKVSA